jgi:hypothetical protein
MNGLPTGNAILDTFAVEPQSGSRFSAQDRLSVKPDLRMKSLLANPRNELELEGRINLAKVAASLAVFVPSTVRVPRKHRCQQCATGKDTARSVFVEDINNI